MLCPAVSLIMKRRTSYLAVSIVLCALIGVAVWAVLRFKAIRRQALHQSTGYLSNLPGPSSADADLWNRAVEQVKADRGESAVQAPVETPPELRHYSDRHWFLATQVAEVRKYNVRSCQDFVDLAAMLERGEMVSVPAVTDTYILYGVGATADGGVFSRYEDDHSIELLNEGQLRDEYKHLDDARSNLQTEISGLQTQLRTLKKRDRNKQSELQKEIAARQQQLTSTEEDKAQLDRFYGQPDSGQRLLKDYESLQTLARNFAGRSFNIEESSDREAMKVAMLRSLRPEALKILEEIAKEYHDKFDRPLPVSSLIRPEQYQHALNRVNRNAVLIDTPPHSTGLAFDIDYRYMAGAEQSFLMTELARMKDEGRIEVIRERNANYHVFAFIDGKRPSDELIAASLDEAQAPVRESNHATKKPAKENSNSKETKNTKAKSKARNLISKSKLRKR